jgi:hypothetical protein
MATCRGDAAGGELIGLATRGARHRAPGTRRPAPGGVTIGALLTPIAAMNDSDPKAPAPAPEPRKKPMPTPYKRVTPPGKDEPLDPTRYGDWEKNGRCIDF